MSELLDFGKHGQLTLNEFIEGFSGKLFGGLILHHFKKQTPAELKFACFKEISCLRIELKDAVEQWIDRWGNVPVFTEIFTTDCKEVLQIIAEDAKDVISGIVDEYTDKDVLNFVMIIILSYSWNASINRTYRKELKKKLRVL